ncbi:alkaline phosphatase family protein [Paraflavitalea pollutisoli]|uniref:alkaline phosphatase family protein n=1 Tax=Paraflavitalea pollutisoli TaxID=3034143 RepID=UPI0023EBCD63|nr:alkaline phosphatase family protein [Paraflavitalea sp. H1-2-19X]
MRAKHNNNIFRSGLGWKTAAWLSFVVAGIAVAACNKTFENNLRDDYGPGGGAGKKQKMLVILVDGAAGLEVQKSRAPYLTVMSDNAIYSWNGLTDTKKTPVTNALGWATLLTGVTADKHKVTGEDFTGSALQQYPTLFARLKQEKPGARTVAYGATAAFIDNLAADATEKKTYASDAAVKDAALAELTKGSGDLVLAQFHDVDAAGAAGAYSANDAGYKAAILKTDEYVQTLVESLTSRATYALENWMIIVTSNKGSVLASDPVAADKLAYDDSRRNTFFVCYAPNLKVSYKPGSLPFSGTTPVYQGGSAAATRAIGSDIGNLLDFGASGSYTIECKVKIPAGNFNYPAFLSKRSTFARDSVGWVLFLEGNYWQINFGQLGSGNRQIRGAAIADGKWHTLTVTINQQNATTRRVETFTDGVYYDGGITDASRNINGYGNLTSRAAFQIGQLNPDNVTGLSGYNVTDVKIYDTAFSRDYVGTTFCRTALPVGDPYERNLIGYWSGREIATVGGRKALAGVSGKYATTPGFSNDKLALYLSGNYGTSSFVEVLPNICPTPDANSFKVVPNSVDLVTQVCAWLGVNPPASWQLDGSTWLTSFMNL